MPDARGFDTALATGPSGRSTLVRRHHSTPSAQGARRSAASLYVGRQRVSGWRRQPRTPGRNPRPVGAPRMRQGGCGRSAARSAATRSILLRLRGRDGLGRGHLLLDPLRHRHDCCAPSGRLSYHKQCLAVVRRASIADTVGLRTLSLYNLRARPPCAQWRPMAVTLTSLAWTGRCFGCFVWKPEWHPI